MENILDRLELQVESYQESFSILSRSKNLEDLAKKFFHILRGNLLVVDMAVFHRPKNQEQWQPLYLKNSAADQCLELLDDNTEFEISFPDHAQFQVCINQPQIDKSTFKILLGKKLNKAEYDEFDKISLQFFLQQLDSAYQFYISRNKEKKLIFNLNHKVLQLNSLIDTGIEVARLQEGTQLLQLALERVLALTNASKGMLRVKEGRSVVEKVYFPFLFKSKNIEHSSYTISAEFRFGNRKYTFYLFDKESRKGRVAFDMNDRLLLDAFARQVHVSLENHFLYEQSLEKERVEKEVSVAGTIQDKLIPDPIPGIEGYDIAGLNIPTKYVGGDYYDCIPLKDGRYALVIADVSGKGIPAALLVSTLQASLHAYLDSPFELPDLTQKLNMVIYNAATIDKYITAFFAILDPKTGELEAVSAGHNPTYIIRKNKKVDELSTGGIPLGMMGMPFPYTSDKHILNPGDRLLLYTDGVTEAMNEDEEEYDDLISLEKFIKANNPQDARQFIDDLYQSINDFTGNTPQSDDITALYLIRT